MRVGASLALIALGAVLKFAVSKQVNGVNLQTVGVVLMVVGAAGLVIAMVMLAMRRRTDVVYRRDGATLLEPAERADPRI